MSGLLVEDFNYDLPPELIAQQPPTTTRHEPHAGNGPANRRSAG